MAITKVALTPDTFGFAVNGTSANASGCEELVATPGAGKYLHLRQVTISSAAAISITLGTGAAAGSVAHAVLGPIAFAANQTIQWVFNPSICLTVDESLTVDADGAGVLTVFAQGFVS